MLPNPQSIINLSVKQEEVKKAEPTLFEKFGGDEKMKLFVDEILTAFMADPDLAGPHAKVTANAEKFENLK